MVDEHQWGTSFAQQPLLFHNLRNGKFERIGAAPGSGLAYAWPSRGLAVGDLDGDGRLDVVINNLDSKPTVLRNVTTIADTGWSYGLWATLQGKARAMQSGQSLTLVLENCASARRSEWRWLLFAERYDAPFWSR